MCRRFARQFCQTAVKNKSIISGLLSLAPTDPYGSLISGGFTIALAALEAHENLRTEMEQSLAQIPKELKRIRSLNDVYIQRDELHKHADDVLVSIFTVLERIIEKFSCSWKESLSLKFKDHRGSVQDALKTLSDSITDFNHEAEVCAHLRMGRVEETSQAIKLALDGARDVVNGTNTKVNELEALVKEMYRTQNRDMPVEAFQDLVRAVNRLYSFIASNPDFNAVKGTVNRKYLVSARGSNGHNWSPQLVDKWLRSLRDFRPSPKDDLEKLIPHSHTLTIEEQDKIQHIMGCQQFQGWLGEPHSSTLCVRAETTPDDIVNFMSVSTATLALTLGGATEFLFLSFFCSLRKKSSPREQDSGALGILKSLNGQLLQTLLDRQLRIKTGFGQDDDMRSKSIESFRHSCRLFRKLMASLPSRSVVFVLLDSVSRTSGDKGLVEDFAKEIMRIGRNSSSIVVKLLVTDPIPSSHIWTAADFKLYVPDDVDGWQCGMNAESMKRKNASTLRDLEELQEESQY